MDTFVNDVIGFVAGHATEDDLNTILDAIKLRRSVLKNARQAELTVGTWVETTGLSPKYCNFLQGELIGKGKSSTVLLDERSTSRLRISGAKRFYIPASTERYELTGIPAGCLKEVDR